MFKMRNFILPLMATAALAQASGTFSGDIEKAIK